MSSSDNPHFWHFLSHGSGGNSVVWSQLSAGEICLSLSHLVLEIITATFLEEKKAF